MYITQKVVNAYASGTGEMIQLSIGSTLEVWTSRQMALDGVDKPVAKARKISYEHMCLRRTETLNMNRRFTREQQDMMWKKPKAIYNFVQRWDLPNPELFTITGGNHVGNHVWVSKDDLVKL